MISQLRAELRLLYELLADNKTASAVVTRRDLGNTHDSLFNAEPYVAVVGVQVLHELKKTFNDKTSEALRTQVEAAIKAVDAIRAARTPPIPPSGPIEEEGKAPATPDVPEACQKATEEAPAAGLAPVVPFEQVKAEPAPEAPAPQAG